MYIAVNFLLVIFPAILKPWLCQKFYVRIPAKLLFCLVILPCFLPSHVPVPNCPTACPSIDLTTCLPRVGPCPETNQVQSCGEYPGHPDPWAVCPMERFNVCLTSCLHCACYCSVFWVLYLLIRGGGVWWFAKKITTTLGIFFIWDLRFELVSKSSQWFFFIDLEVLLVQMCFS